MATYAAKARDGFEANDITAVDVTVSGTITGDVTGDLTGNIVQTAITAEHGAGAVGTGAVPKTYRRTENGVIITEIKVDLTGLNSGGAANDAIGLVATDACYIGRNVVANNGVVYLMELICLETPAGGDTDINVVMSATADIQEDEAAGTTYGVNGGTLAAGLQVSTETQSLTEGHYIYLASGGTTNATYTAGQIIVRLHGHALLT